MWITVEYTAQLKQAAGVAAERLQVDDGMLLQDLLRHIANSHGPQFESVLWENKDRPRASILIFVNDQQVAGSHPLPLEDRSVVALISPISGG